jgi:hypothetical protein
MYAKPLIRNSEGKEDPGVKWNIILKRILKKDDGIMSKRLTCFWIGTSGELL